jgi:ferredoxin-nitrite reductase
MNKFEEIKATKDGLDVWPDILRYAREGWEAISDDDKARMKWYGLFFRKHTPGYFMLRIRLPNGIASAAQLRAVAGIASDFGRSELDITTRQQIQVRWFRIEHVPEIFSRLNAVGLDSRQTGMDNIRNVMGCPLAGITPHELFDASPAVRAFTMAFVGNPEFTNLPRKFNVAITGCPSNCVALESQDIALVPAEKLGGDGLPVYGCNVLVGGKMGSGGFTPAQPVNAFVHLDEAAEVCCRIVEIFRDYGPRESRSQARLSFLLEDWGMERFREALEERLGRPLPEAGADARWLRQGDHVGVEPQKELGKYSVGLSVPVGRLTSDQTLAAANLADCYGAGEARLTPGQNLILTHVPDKRLAELLAEPLLQQLRPDPSLPLRGTVSCTGAGLCDLALTDTKRHALKVARQLEEMHLLERPIAINWSGCPAGCGNHQVADIGLQGGKARVGNEVIEVYQVFAGGRGGRAARPAAELLNGIPATEIADVVERLVEAHESGHDLVQAARQIALERGAANQAAA